MNKDRTPDQDGPKDLGTSSDRAMFGESEERGRGSSMERNDGQSRSSHQGESGSAGSQDRHGGSSNSGGISNRELDREEREQQQVPERGSGSRDAGRTQGGGSGGHSPTTDVQDQANLRNNSRSRDE